MAAPSAGYLIYASSIPLVKIYLCIACGYLLARKGLFGPAATRGASLIFMNVALPSLIFANIVPAFTPDNVSAIGPLLLLAFTYQLLGFIFGMIIREIFYVPRNFWQGIVVMCGMNNWSNLPNAVVMSITQQSPFDPVVDTQLGVSFIAIFIVSYHVMFWVFGTAYTLAWDYRPGVPQGEAAELRCTWDKKPFGSLFARFVLRRPDHPITLPPFTQPTDERSNDQEERAAETDSEARGGSPPNPPPNAATRTESTFSNEKQEAESGVTTSPPQPAQRRSRRPHIFANFPKLRRVWSFFTSMFTPITSSLYISLPIALTRPLKALFVPVPQSMGGGATVLWRAPDGRAPLALVIDTAQLLGNLAVPLALIVLGASFARCRIPRPLSRLPIMAMLGCAAAKMVILPVIGVSIVRTMVKSGMIPREAKVEQFVAMLLSGTPAAVNQLIAASLYAPNGDVDLQAAFFLVQYVFMLFTSSGLTAVSLILI